MYHSIRVDGQENKPRIIGNEVNYGGNMTQEVMETPAKSSLQ